MSSRSMDQTHADTGAPVQVAPSENPALLVQLLSTLLAAALHPTASGSFPSLPRNAGCSAEHPSHVQPRQTAYVGPREMHATSPPSPEPVHGVAHSPAIDQE